MKYLKYTTFTWICLGALTFSVGFDFAFGFVNITTWLHLFCLVVIGLCSPIKKEVGNG
jgi:hypothetical protein